MWFVIAVMVVSQPKMGKINIDYQILHDAFFKFQTKPQLSKHGDMCVHARADNCPCCLNTSHT